MNNRHKEIVKITIATILLALGWVLPFITAQNGELGNMFNLIHIPTLITGFVLGPLYGLVIGFITPITRSLLFGMPPLYPMAFSMAFEMATYGLISGLLLYIFKKNIKTIVSIYLSLVIALICGKVVWGISRVIFGYFGANQITFKIFIIDSFVKSFPGTIIQLILIPTIYFAVKKLSFLGQIME